MKFKDYVDLGLHRAAALRSYFERKGIESDIDPIFKNDPSGMWRICYNDTEDWAVSKCIEKWTEAKNRGLKFCPFCGGIPALECVFQSDSILGFSYRVLCSECHVSTDVYDTEGEAIKVWNSRFY